MNNNLLMPLMFFLVCPVALAQGPLTPEILIPASTNPTISAPEIDWGSLCFQGQSLVDPNGCTPDCNTLPTAVTCNAIYNMGQVEKITGIPRPYLSNGVVVFKLTQTGSKGSNALFNIFLNKGLTASTGYACEILNADATPAILWDSQNKIPFSTNVITLESTVHAASNAFANAVLQPAVGNYRWYNNPNNPLYMICLGYIVTDTEEGASLRSREACGGPAGNACISYLLE